MTSIKNLTILLERLIDRYSGPIDCNSPHGIKISKAIRELRAGKLNLHFVDAKGGIHDMPIDDLVECGTPVDPDTDADMELWTADDSRKEPVDAKADENRDRYREWLNDRVGVGNLSIDQMVDMLVKYVPPGVQLEIVDQQDRLDQNDHDDDDTSPQPTRSNA